MSVVPKYLVVVLGIVIPWWLELKDRTEHRDSYIIEVIFFALLRFTLGHYNFATS